MKCCVVPTWILIYDLFELFNPESLNKQFFRLRCKKAAQDDSLPRTVETHIHLYGLNLEHSLVLRYWPFSDFCPVWIPHPSSHEETLSLFAQLKAVAASIMSSYQILSLEKKKGDSH